MGCREQVTWGVGNRSRGVWGAGHVGCGSRSCGVWGADYVRCGDHVKWTVG